MPHCLCHGTTPTRVPLDADEAADRDDARLLRRRADRADRAARTVDEQQHYEDDRQAEADRAFRERMDAERAAYLTGSGWDRHTGWDRFGRRTWTSSDPMEEDRYE